MIQLYFIKLLWWSAGLIISLPVFASSSNNKLTVAVASNFYHPLKQLIDNNESLASLPLVLSSGSTGVLFAQIKQGAPYDVFLAADSERPKLLLEQGLTKTRKTYASGTLVLWPTMHTEQDSLKQTLMDYKGKLVIANPRLAPYGKAAEQVLQQLALTKQYQGRLIKANNVNQAFQFIYTANADKGIIALSQLRLAQQSSFLNQASLSDYQLVPKHLYEPIKQQLVVLNSSDNQMLAKRFVDIILTDKIQKQLHTMGYNHNVD